MSEPVHVRSTQVESSMGSSRVVMDEVLPDDRLQVSTTEDEHPVQAFAA
jgi:hypothetical protein